MLKIRFLRDYKVRSEVGESYKKGKVVELEEASCNHFVTRGIAVFATKGEGKKKAAKKAAKKTTKKTPSKPADDKD